MERNRYIKAQIEAQVCSSLAEINSNFTVIIDKYNNQDGSFESQTTKRLLKNLSSLLGDLEQVCLHSDIKVYTIDYLKEQINSALNNISKQRNISIGGE